MRKQLAIGLSLFALTGLGGVNENFVSVHSQEAHQKYTHLVETSQSQTFEPFVGASLFADLPNRVSFQTANVSFIASDVKDLAYSEDYDVLVVDPPRSGLGEDFIKMILDKKPKRIAYVSCFPPSLKEDMTKLAKAYTFEPVTLFDQFGFTDHMEALSIANLH